MKSNLETRCQSCEIPQPVPERRYEGQGTVGVEVASDAGFEGVAGEKTNLSREPEWAAANCFGLSIGRPSEVDNFYRGYVSGGIVAVMIVVFACIALFLTGNLP